MTTIVIDNIPMYCTMLELDEKFSNYQNISKNLIEILANYMESSVNVQLTINSNNIDNLPFSVSVDIEANMSDSTLVVDKIMHL